MFEVIEHLKDPGSMLKQVKAMLQGRGRLILSTPNRERYLADLADWDYPPLHLTRWNRDSLANLLRLAGLKIVRLQYVDELAILAAALTSKFRFGLVKKTVEAMRNTETLAIIPKVLYRLANAKERLIGSPPAAILLMISRIQGRRNGTIFVEAHLGPEWQN